VHPNMRERLRLYDIFRAVSLQSCQHEYIHVHGSMHGGGNNVRNVRGSDVRDSIRRPLLVACRLRNAFNSPLDNSIIFFADHQGT
jgi:hypothetical protein